MPWTPPPGTAALIFDCDGTLADTMPLHYRAWAKLFGRLGMHFPEARFYALGGVPTGRIIGIVAAEHGANLSEPIERLVAEKESDFLELVAEIRPVPAVWAIAQEWRGRLPMAVASGGYREVVGRTLAAIGADWFDAVVCAEDTVLHKPDPDVFLEAARRLGVPASSLRSVRGPRTIGVEAARRAGMKWVDVRELTR